MRLSSSLISRILDSSECPYKIKAVYIDKTAKSVPTQSMLNGLFFEQEVLGVKPGNSPVSAKLLKNGNVSTDSKRIIDQAKFTKDVLFPMWGIDPGKIQPFQRFSLDFKEDDLTLSGEFDILCEVDDPELGRVDAIIDLKLTKNINYEDGKGTDSWSWRYPQNRDHTQAYMYKHAYKLLFQKSPQFYYFVLDYKPTPEYKIVRKKIGDMELRELHRSIETTKDKIVVYNKDGWPYKPEYKNCKNCPLLNSCKYAIRRPPVDEV